MVVTVEDLPLEVIVTVLSHLDWPSLAAADRTNRLFHNAIQADSRFTRVREVRIAPSDRHSYQVGMNNSYFQSQTTPTNIDEATLMYGTTLSLLGGGEQVQCVFLPRDEAPEQCDEGVTDGEVVHIDGDKTRVFTVNPVKSMQARLEGIVERGQKTLPSFHLGRANKNRRQVPCPFRLPSLDFSFKEMLSVLTGRSLVLDSVAETMRDRRPVQEELDNYRLLLNEPMLAMLTDLFSCLTVHSFRMYDTFITCDPQLAHSMIVATGARWMDLWCNDLRERDEHSLIVSPRTLYTASLLNSPPFKCIDRLTISYSRNMNEGNVPEGGYRDIELDSTWLRSILSSGATHIDIRHASRITHAHVIIIIEAFRRGVRSPYFLYISFANGVNPSNVQAALQAYSSSYAHMYRVPTLRGDFLRVEVKGKSITVTKCK